MSYEPKTVAIDSSELLERQREAGSDSGALPRTIPIDSQEIARRQAAGAARPARASAAVADDDEHEEAETSWARVLIVGSIVGLSVAWLLAR